MATTTTCLADAATPTTINQAWVGDITYIPFLSRTFGYCAVLLDLYSGLIVGWSYRQNMTEGLGIEALSMVIKTQRPGVGLIHHSERGGQKAEKRYLTMLVRASKNHSMSAEGNCFDNPLTESCFGKIKTELSIEDYAGHADALREIRTHVSYNNVDRIHSSLGDVKLRGFELQPQLESGNAKYDPNAAAQTRVPQSGFDQDAAQRRLSPWP
ncbi:MAG: DDE-type integrase/transposase/recombinase [Planctomycetota bacterium]